MTDQISKAALFKLGKAKSGLILEQPFFASILCSMKFIEHNNMPIKTMATDGKNVFYDAAFVEEHTPDEIKFVLCHEALHCVFQHMFRKGDRIHMKWNKAGDYIINDLLSSENVGQMPKGGLHNPALVAAAKGTTEGVYDLLPDDDSKGDGHGGAGGDPLDDCMDAGGTQAERSAAEAEMKVVVAQAAQAAKMMGKLSAGLERFVDGALRPKVKWQDVLRRFVNARAKIEYTYGRPKRRFLGEDIYLPSLGGNAMGEILIAVDCSGSIGEEELNEFATEMAAIKADVNPSAMHVEYFDSRVCHYDKFEQDEELSVKPHGGGGTAFSPIFRYAEEHGIEPVCCVVLTDLYCNDFGPPPPHPVLWVTTGATAAPWGEVIQMKPEHLG